MAHLDSGSAAINPAAMTEMIVGILNARGCTAEEAQICAAHLVDANLTGHDSHGVIRVPRYDHWLAQGTINPARPLELIADLGGALQFTGNDGIGQFLARQAIAAGIERTASTGLTCVALRRAGHVGRVGSFAEQACAAGLVSVIFVNVAGSSLVAPFGAAGRAISTAPVSIGVPNPGGEDFILDFATSKVAEGKALVAARGGKALPKDALIGADGRPTADPVALYGESIDTKTPDPSAGPGALRAMGDHKGSGLALACELLAGALTGNGANGLQKPPFGNGMLAFLIDPARFDDSASFGAEVAGYLGFVQGLPPAAGVDQVLTPGDRERSLRRERQQAGFPLPYEVLDTIIEVARGHGAETSRADIVMGA